MCAVRGNLFSFAFGWVDIWIFMDERTPDEQLASWPHAPDVVVHSVRAALKRGEDSIIDHTKELKVRAAVAHGLSRPHICRHLDNLKMRVGSHEI